MSVCLRKTSYYILGLVTDDIPHTHSEGQQVGRHHRSHCEHHSFAAATEVGAGELRHVT